MKVVVAASNQEKALVGAFSVITNLRMDLFEALVGTCPRHLTRDTAGQDAIHNTCSFQLGGAPQNAIKLEIIFPRDTSP